LIEARQHGIANVAFRTFMQVYPTGRHSDDDDLQDRLDEQMKRLKAEREAMPEVHDACESALA